MKAKALIVEDDSTTSKMLLNAVTKMGLQGDTAEDGAEALYKICTGNYSIVLLDLMMPVVGGMEVISVVEQLQQRKLFKGTCPHIVVCSAVQDHAYLKKLTEYHCVQAVISKPFDMNQLTRTIEILTGGGSESSKLATEQRDSVR